MEQIARELGVAYILEGSVRKAGARVRVTGQLTSTKDGGNLWADRFDRDLTDIFAIQDEITHAIVAQLKVKLLPQEAESIGQDPTDNVEAYTYYLRGRDFLHRRSKHYCRIARQMFAKAVALDPNYARAYAGMADCDSFLYLNYRVDVPIDALLATTEKALSLDNTLPEAHASRSPLLDATLKQTRNSRKRLPSTQIYLKPTTVMRAPVLPKGNSNKPRDFSNALPSFVAMIISQFVC